MLAAKNSIPIIFYQILSRIVACTFLDSQGSNLTDFEFIYSSINWIQNVFNGTINFMHILSIVQIL